MVDHRFFQFFAKRRDEIDVGELQFGINVVVEDQSILGLPLVGLSLRGDFPNATKAAVGNWEHDWTAQRFRKALGLHRSPSLKAPRNRTRI